MWQSMAWLRHDRRNVNVRKDEGPWVLEKIGKNGMKNHESHGRCTSEGSAPLSLPSVAAGLWVISLIFLKNVSTCESLPPPLMYEVRHVLQRGKQSSVRGCKKFLPALA